MSGLLRTGDFLYTLRFIRLLTMPWTKTSAFKNGIIDDKGKTIKKTETKKEKESYTPFHRLVFNIKRLLEKVPGGKMRISSYIAALFLIKENAKLSDKKLKNILIETFGFDKTLIEEYEAEPNGWYIKEDTNNSIAQGNYSIIRDLPSTRGKIIEKKSILYVEQHPPIGTIFEHNVYRGVCKTTGEVVCVTQEDIVVV